MEKYELTMQNIILKIKPETPAVMHAQLTVYRGLQEGIPDAPCHQSEETEWNSLPKQKNEKDNYNKENTKYY